MNPLTISWLWHKRCQGRSRKRWIFNLKLSWKAKEIEIRLAKSPAENITFFHKYVLFYSLELQMQFYSRAEEVCNLHKSLRVSSNEFIFWLSSYSAEVHRLRFEIVSVDRGSVPLPRDGPVETNTDKN
jgi:hypothetical protein